MLPTVAVSSPFLVVNPPAAGTATPTYYMVSGIGQDTAQFPYPLHVDVAALAGTGSHTARAKACNLWGCSTWSDPYPFDSAVPAAPLGLGLSQ